MVAWATFQVNARSSTLMVQRRAEVSRGGLLHHFPSKDALLVAAAQHLAAVRVAETGGCRRGLHTARRQPGAHRRGGRGDVGALPGGDAFDGRAARHARYLADWRQVACAVLLASP